MHMKTIFVGSAITAMALGALLPRQWDWLLAAPYCAQLCLVDNMKIAPACNLNDLTCYCDADNFISTFEDCAANNCTTPEIAETVAYVEALCYHEPHLSKCASDCMFENIMPDTKDCALTGRNTTCLCTENKYLGDVLLCTYNTCTNAETNAWAAWADSACGWS